MKHLLFFLLLLSGITLKAGAQTGQPYNRIKENNTWIFGNNAGLNFNTPGNPAAITTPVLEHNLGTSAVSDTAGQLLFYANRDNVWYPNGTTMPNGTNLIPPTPIGFAIWINPTSLIVPDPGNINRYYVFSITTYIGVSGVPAYTPDHGILYYSVVDMTLNGGLGDVVPGQKGIRIDSMLCSKLVSVEAASCGIWLVSMRNDGSAIHAFKITDAGIDAVPVVSPCPVTSVSPALNLQTFTDGPNSCIRASGDGKKLAITLHRLNTSVVGYQYSGGFQLYDFDKATGIASNQVNVIPPGLSNMLALDQAVTSLCFSPDNTKLYMPHGTMGPGIGLYQYDITSGVAATILASRVELCPPGDIRVTARSAIRLGPDDKIYIADGGHMINGVLQGKLHRVENPNVAGTGATLTFNAITLAPGTNTDFSLGNATVARPIPDTVYKTSRLTLCAPDTMLDLNVPLDPAYTYLWDDGTTAHTRTITGGGRYWVAYGKFCPRMVDTFVVEEVDTRFDLGPDTTFCADDIAYTLAPGIAGATYLWQDGSNRPAFTVTQAGQYYVTLSREGCTTSDTVDIRTLTLPQDLGRDTVLCAGVPILIRLDARVPDGATVLWNTGSTDPSITVTAKGTYNVAVSKDGCMGFGSRTVSTEMCDCIQVMPNAFSPNGDGLNDIFVPVIAPGCPVNGYSFNIYNRWGARVFTSTTPGAGWDGTAKGLALETGTYMFTISFEKGTQRHPYSFKGDVTLVR